MDTVTVIIPVYNVEQYITECLQSVFAQRYKYLEIIMVDDCSPDTSINIAQALQKDCPSQMRMVFLTQERNQGLSVARNRGINAATGKYIYFLDSDDVITDNCIELQVKIAQEQAVEMVCCRERRFTDIQEFSRKSLFKDKTLTTWKTKEDIFQAFCQERWPLIACNKLLLREALIKHKLFFIPGILHEDGPWSLQCAVTMDSMAMVEQVTLGYRVSEASITVNAGKRNIESFGIVIEQIYKTISELPDELKKIGAQWFETKVRVLSSRAVLTLTMSEFIKWFKKTRLSRFPWSILDIKTFQLSDKIFIALRYLPLPIGILGYFSYKIFRFFNITGFSGTKEKKNS